MHMREFSNKLPTPRGKKQVNIIPVIISMWGISCQDLTAYAEGHAGTSSYAGLRSVLMHAAPLIHWVLLINAKDTVLLLMMENVGWIHET